MFPFRLPVLSIPYLSSSFLGIPLNLAIEGLVSFPGGSGWSQAAKLFVHFQLNCTSHDSCVVGGSRSLHFKLKFYFSWQMCWLFGPLGAWGPGTVLPLKTGLFARRFSHLTNAFIHCNHRQGISDSLRTRGHFSSCLYVILPYLSNLLSYSEYSAWKILSVMESGS